MKPTNDEQEICLTCGICCDQTLFDIVIIQDGDHLPEKLQERRLMHEGKAYFSLPCPYFVGHCSIYDHQKPKRCSEYRCWLLKRRENDEISQQEALKIIEDVRDLRAGIIRDYAAITGNKKSFREIYRDLARSEEEVKAMPIELKTVHYRCNILQVQLSRWFKAPEEFETYFQSMD